MSEDIKLRLGAPEDAERCGRICYNAFKTISEAHGFPPDFAAPGVAIGVLRSLLANPKFYSVIAEVDGQIVGSNFLDERNRIAGVGPITVDPNALQQPRLTFRQNLHDFLDGVPIARGGRHTEELLEFAKVADRLHLPAIQTENESALDRNHFEQPVVVRRQT
jgi:hypothetical protein